VLHRVRYLFDERNLGRGAVIDQTSQASNSVSLELDGQSSLPNSFSASSRTQRQMRIPRVSIPAI
jgi:hypothetical protein